MENITLEMVIKIIGVLCSPYGFFWSVKKIMLAVKLTRIAEYHHANSFISELDELHPYIKEIGFYTMTGIRKINEEGMKYLISLKDPYLSIKLYIKGRKYFAEFDKKLPTKIKFKDEYQSKFYRNLLTGVYITLYIVFTVMAMSLVAFSSHDEVKLIPIELSAILFLYSSFLACFMLNRSLEIVLAKKLYKEQEVHEDFKIIKNTK